MLGSWDIEEAGCQAHEKFLSGSENCWGIDFLKVLNCSYKALRLPVRPVAEAQKGSGVAEGLLSSVGPWLWKKVKIKEER